MCFFQISIDKSKQKRFLLIIIIFKMRIFRR